MRYTTAAGRIRPAGDTLPRTGEVLCQGLRSKPLQQENPAGRMAQALQELSDEEYLLFTTGLFASTITVFSQLVSLVQGM